MRTMSWNATLATIATNYARTCPGGNAALMPHNPNRLNFNPPMGENIYGQSNTFTNIIPGSVTWWTGERAYYTLGPSTSCPTVTNYICGTCTPKSPYSECTHYTQIAWANTNQIGCARVFCNNYSSIKYTVVCDFTPMGNIITQGPYLRASYTCNGIVNTASNVCNSQGTCTNYNICTCKNGYTGQYCTTPAAVCNGITYPNTQCSGQGQCIAGACQCVGGYTGNNCQNAPSVSGTTDSLTAWSLINNYRVQTLGLTSWNQDQTLMNLATTYAQNCAQNGFTSCSSGINYYWFAYESAYTAPASSVSPSLPNQLLTYIQTSQSSVLQYISGQSTTMAVGYAETPSGAFTARYWILLWEVTPTSVTPLEINNISNTLEEAEEIEEND